MITKKILWLLVLCLLSPHAFSDDPACAAKVENGGLQTLQITEKLDFTDFFGFPLTRVEIAHVIAEEAQEEFGNKVASDGVAGVTIQYITVGGPAVSVATLPDIPGSYYRGEHSLQKEILNRLLKSERDKPDPSPCDPEKNASNKVGSPVFTYFQIDLDAIAASIGSESNSLGDEFNGFGTGGFNVVFTIGSYQGSHGYYD